MTNEDTEDEIAALNARRLQLETARTKRAESDADDRRLEDAKRALADEEAIGKAEQEHGARRIAVLKTEFGALIVKRPHANTFRKFQDSGKVDTETLEKLVRPCLVYPSVEAFERICAELPATLGHLSLAIGRLAGIRAEELAAKS